MKALNLNEIQTIDGARSNPGEQVPAFIACHVVGVVAGTLILPGVGTVVGGFGLPALYVVLEGNV